MLLKGEQSSFVCIGLVNLVFHLGVKYLQARMEVEDGLAAGCGLFFCPLTGVSGLVGRSEWMGISMKLEIHPTDESLDTYSTTPGNITISFHLKLTTRPRNYIAIATKSTQKRKKARTKLRVRLLLF
jgi:hypothetical protein